MIWNEWKNLKTYLDLWKLCENSIKFVMKILLSKFNFSHVKRANSRNFEMLVHLGWCFALCLWKNHVHQLLVGGYDRNTLEVVSCSHFDYMIIPKIRLWRRKKQKTKNVKQEEKLSVSHWHEALGKNEHERNNAAQRKHAVLLLKAHSQKTLHLMIISTIWWVSSASCQDNLFTLFCKEIKFDQLYLYNYDWRIEFF